ncbi:hypothetical protein ACFL2U_00115 [Patescibacteria group bacterium]
MNKVTFSLIISFFLTSLALARPGDINYNKKEILFGETVYFNHGDAYWPYERAEFDQNGYMYPEVFPYLEKAKFIHLETDDNGEPTKVYLLLTRKATGKNYVLSWERIMHVVPQQNVIILNW